jgi:uncharacterized protein (TIGR03067 family)
LDGPAHDRRWRGDSPEKLKAWGTGVVFTGNKFNWTDGPALGEKAPTVVLDATKKPKTMDIGLPGLPPGLLIYELDGDLLRLCSDGGGKGRPTEFSSPKGSKLILMVLKREKK